MAFGSAKQGGFGSARFVRKAIQQVKEIEVTYGVTIESAVAGGISGGNDIVPTDPSALLGDESTKGIVLTNPGTTPASVELSFDNNYLQGVVGDFDQGTATSPTYVVDPTGGTGQTRTIQLGRGSVNVPSSPSTELIEFTGNAGVFLRKVPVVVHESSLLHLLVRAKIGVPTIEYKCDTLLNTGTLGSDWNLTAYNTASAAVETSVAAVVGAISMLATADRVQTGTSADRNRYRRLSAADSQSLGLADKRTWIWVFAAKSDPASQYYLGSVYQYSYGIPGVPGYYSSANNALSMLADGASGGINSNWKMDTTRHHTVGGATSSELIKITPGMIDKVIVIAMTHNGDGTGTTRWKQKDHGTGFSYHDWTGHTYNPITNATGYEIGIFGGHPWGSYTSNDIDHYYHAVFDSEITDSNFTDICGALSL
jgi:hypothetical protein